jgi:signal transduction histidine kinase
VTERRAVERTRAALLEAEQRARARSDQENRTKDDFLATLSHELRTPLGVILGWSDLLRQGMVDEPRRERALNAIHESASLQVQMVDDLLDTARISSGKLQLTRGRVDLRELVRNVIESMQPKAEAKGIQIAQHVEPGLTEITGDPDRLTQVLLNLLTNAIKFTPQAGTIRIGVRAGLTMVEIEVADTGCGIAPAFLPHVFEPFQQADTSNARAHHGLGLGLSIVKRLVEAHGGTVTADSPGEGHGATFLVRLPIIDGDSGVAETATVVQTST